MVIKDEKGSTLLLKLFAILFGIFIVFGYVFVHTVNSTGKLIFQKTDDLCNINTVGYCFSIEILYMVALIVIAALGFLSVSLITLEWGTRRLPEERFGAGKSSSLPDFYRNTIVFLNCLKIAIAVLFCSMFLNYSKATLIFPIAVIASLCLDSFVWNKRCREVNRNHKSLFLDVILEFMNIFNFKKNQNGCAIRHRQSLIFYVAATILIVFCIHAVSTRLIPDINKYKELSPENIATLALADSIITADLEARAKKQETIKLKQKKRRYKKTVPSENAVQIQSNAPVNTAASTSTTTNSDEDDWW